MKNENEGRVERPLFSKTKIKIRHKNENEK